MTYVIVWVGLLCDISSGLVYILFALFAPCAEQERVVPNLRFRVVSEIVIYPDQSTACAA